MKNFLCDAKDVLSLQLPSAAQDILEGCCASSGQSAEEKYNYMRTRTLYSIEEHELEEEEMDKRTDV